jgi:hypothetical protein
MSLSTIPVVVFSQETRGPYWRCSRLLVAPDSPAILFRNEDRANGAVFIIPNRLSLRFVTNGQFRVITP